MVASPGVVLRRATTSVGAVAVLFAGLLAGMGWLYVLRSLGWLASGPRVADALPLLQLAGGDGQPLVRVLVAWALAGVLAGVALHAVAPGRRGVIAGVAALAGLLLLSQAAYALTRNLGFTAILFSRSPGSGPVVEGLAFAAGCALPGSRGQRNWVAAARRAAAASRGGLRQRRLGAGEHGDGGHHDGDGHQVEEHRPGVRA